jgi:hypothetical protein
MINFLEDTLKKLSQALQKFRCDTCLAFNSVELPKEKQACQKKFTQHSQTNASTPESSRLRTKIFNLNTYKFHAMADYVSMIRLFGTTDSYTTQMVSIWSVLIACLNLSLAMGSLRTEL